MDPDLCLYVPADFDDSDADAPVHPNAMGLRVNRRGGVRGFRSRWVIAGDGGVCRFPAGTGEAPGRRGSCLDHPSSQEPLVSLYLVPPSVASSEGAAEGAVPGGGALM